MVFFISTKIRVKHPANKSLGHLNTWLYITTFREDGMCAVTSMSSECPDVRQVGGNSEHQRTVSNNEQYRTGRRGSLRLGEPPGLAARRPPWLTRRLRPLRAPILAGHYAPHRCRVLPHPLGDTTLFLHSRIFDQNIPAFISKVGSASWYTSICAKCKNIDSYIFAYIRIYFCIFFEYLNCIFLHITAYKR